MRGKQYRPQPPGHEGPRGGKRRGAARSSRKEGETEHKAQLYSVAIKQMLPTNEPWRHSTKQLLGVPRPIDLSIAQLSCPTCPYPHLATRSRSTFAPTSRSVSVILTPGRYCRVSTRVEEYCLYIGQYRARDRVNGGDFGHQVLHRSPLSYPHQYRGRTKPPSQAPTSTRWAPAPRAHP